MILKRQKNILKIKLLFLNLFLLDQTSDSLCLSSLRWQHLLKLNLIYRMIPLLHHNLKQNTTTDIPPEFQKALSNLIRIHTNQVLKMNFELLRVVKILKQHNIRLIPYKGLVLSLMAYGDSNFRSFDDLDILVSEDDDFKPK